MSCLCIRSLRYVVLYLQPFHLLYEPSIPSYHCLTLATLSHIFSPFSSTKLFNIISFLSCSQNISNGILLFTFFSYFFQEFSFIYVDKILLKRFIFSVSFPSSANFSYISFPWFSFLSAKLLRNSTTSPIISIPSLCITRVFTSYLHQFTFVFLAFTSLISHFFPSFLL